MGDNRKEKEQQNDKKKPIFLCRDARKIPTFIPYFGVGAVEDLAHSLILIHERNFNETFRYTDCVGRLSGT